MEQGCLTCGEPRETDESGACRQCGRRDLGPLPSPLPADGDERLLDRIEAALHTWARLRRGGPAERPRALDDRLRAQARLIEDRLGRRPAPSPNHALLDYALTQIERALA